MKKAKLAKNSATTTAGTPRKRKAPDRRLTVEDYLIIDQTAILSLIPTPLLKEHTSKLHDLLYERGCEYHETFQTWRFKADRWGHYDSRETRELLAASNGCSVPVMVTVLARVRGKDKEVMLDGPQLTQPDLRLMALYIKLLREAQHR